MSYTFDRCCDRAAERLAKGIPFNKAIRDSIKGAGWKVTNDRFQRVAKEMRRRSAEARAAHKKVKEVKPSKQEKVKKPKGDVKKAPIKPVQLRLDLGDKPSKKN